MNKYLKIVFYISILILIIISLYPGSLIGYLLYKDYEHQPNLISNPFGTFLNHFIFYVYVSLLGFFLYLKTEKSKKVAFGLFFLAISLELLQSIIPIRAVEIGDLIANILGVIVAYFTIKIYLLFNQS